MTTARIDMAPASSLCRPAGEVWSKLEPGNCHDTSLFSRLVLGCIETKFYNQIRILQQFSKSTKLSSLFFSNLQKIAKFRKICDFLQNFATFSKNQLDSFVDLEKSEKMRIWSQNFVSIQPRTSLEKSDVSWPTVGVSTVLREKAEGGRGTG